MNFILKHLLSIKTASALGTDAIDVKYNANPKGTATFPDPLGGLTLLGLINKIANFLITIGGPVAIIMVLVGAYQMMASVGDPKGFDTGKKTIIYALIGFSILLLGKGLIMVVLNFLES